MNNKLPKDFIVSDEYCVIQPGLTRFNKEQSITHTELNNYMKECKDFKLESILVFPELTQ